MAKDKEYDNWSLADLHAEATRREIEGRSQMDKPALVRALKDDDRAEASPPPAAAAGKARAPRDNRRIVQGVQVYEGAELVTYAGDTEEDHDALEAVLTPEQCERLKESGALEGDWSPKGQRVPMEDSVEVKRPEEAKRRRELREARDKRQQARRDRAAKARK